MNGHTTADNFLTGAYIKSDGSGQTISLDTFASQFLGKQTRYPSLVLSTDEGVGEVGRRNTVSTTDKGRTIPPLVSTVKLYKHLFDRVPASPTANASTETILDAVVEDSNSLSNRLGSRDKQKLEEYMASVRDSEKKAVRAEEWLNTPKPRVLIPQHWNSTRRRSVFPRVPPVYVRLDVSRITNRFDTCDHLLDREHASRRKHGVRIPCRHHR